MLERGYPEVSPYDFYRELFPVGSLQQEPEDEKQWLFAMGVLLSDAEHNYQNLYHT